MARPGRSREWVIKNKSRALKDKTMTVKEAVTRFVYDGDYIASGGFGHVSVSMAIVYEIIRQKKRNLALAGKTAVHDLDILVGTGCVNRVEAAYSFGHELRGLSPRLEADGEDRQVQGGGRNQQRRLPVAVPGGHDGAALHPLPHHAGHGHREVQRRQGGHRPLQRQTDDADAGGLPRCAPSSMFTAAISTATPRLTPTRRGHRAFPLRPPPHPHHGTNREHEVIRSAALETNIPFFVVDAVVEVPTAPIPARCRACITTTKSISPSGSTSPRPRRAWSSTLRSTSISVDNFEDYLEICGGVKKLNYLTRREVAPRANDCPWRK